MLLQKDKDCFQNHKQVDREDTFAQDLLSLSANLITLLTIGRGATEGRAVRGLVSAALLRILSINCRRLLLQFIEDGGS